MNLAISNMNKNPTSIETCKTRAIFTKDARTAWAKIIANAPGREKKKILLPSYIGYTDREGSGVFDPIQSSASDFVFYKLKEDLSPDLEDLELKMNSDIDIVLVIHYFGFCRIDLKIIRQICNDNNTVMVEDCAHAFYLFTNPLGLGEVGDYSFYSIHKYLATQTGGLLKVNNEELSIPEIHGHEAAPASVVEAFALANFEQIAEIRRANYRLFFEQLHNVQGIKVIFELQDKEIPQTFPIQVSNNLREKLYFYLMDRQLETTALYYRLITEISEQDNPISHGISKSILNLPIHQDISVEEVKCMCTEIKNFFNTTKTNFQN